MLTAKGHKRLRAALNSLALPEIAKEETSGLQTSASSQLPRNSKRLKLIDANTSTLRWLIRSPINRLSRSV